MHTAKSQTRLVFVQYGDFADAFERFSSGGRENYYGQRYTVDHVGVLAERHEAVSVIHFSGDAPLRTLSNGVRAMGVDLYPPGLSPRDTDLIGAVQALQPTHLVVAAPIPRLIRWGIDRGLQVLPLFADSFRAAGWRQRLRNWRLQRLLNDRRIRWVANHNIAASLDLERIGVRPGKILPFDWPALISPAQYEAKVAPQGAGFRLVYVGQLTFAKGVGDLLQGFAALPRAAGFRLTLIGSGPEEAKLRELAASLGISERTDFAGKISHDDVLAAMRDHDAVIVPSRHEYPEGLPMTIYEALCTRTPVLASDHPMFMLRLVGDENCVLFPASSPQALAAAVLRLRSSPALYERLSKNSANAEADYLCPLKWHVLLDLWLEGGPASEAQLAEFCLAASRPRAAAEVRPA
ncbi:MAG: glycosyltransferase family 4 protein [Planctomycetes bacterium]|nr:glycosyltransferase family 4 protein [Planctomycetota bacterium]MCB9885852.1 glycosyltransferase family 4 protein [Planctomycetota bacterium]